MFRALGGVLLLLLLVVIASAFQRVRAYQAAYGLTEPRFYGAAFVGWLTLMTAWFAVTVLRGRRERFAFPALASAFALLALLVVVNPEGWIARTNLARAGDPSAALDRSGDGVDAKYLTSLSADVVPALMNGLADLAPRSRCVIARGLLERWGPDAKQRPDWRTWSWPVARARRIVGGRIESLRAMAAGAESASPAGDR